MTMTTIAVTKDNTQDVVNMILKKIQGGSFVVDMYDDTDIGVISYEILSESQKEKFDAVDVIDSSLRTNA